MCVQRCQEGAVFLLKLAWDAGLNHPPFVHDCSGMETEVEMSVWSGDKIMNARQCHVPAISAVNDKCHSNTHSSAPNMMHNVPRMRS